MLFIVLKTIPSHLRLKIWKIVNQGSLTLAQALRRGKKNGTPSDSLDNNIVSPSLMNNPAEIPDGWKGKQPNIPDGWITETENSDYSGRLETKMDQLRIKWAGSSYEIILEKLEMLESWKDLEEDDEGVKEAMIDWMVSNTEDTLVEEGEDILDGLETMENLGEVSSKLLLDSTELITSIIVARRMESEEMMPTFQKDGKQPTTKNISRINRASSMIKIREEIMKKKELRKPTTSRMITEDDFTYLEVKRVTRRSSSNHARGVLASEVDNRLVQDRVPKSK